MAESESVDFPSERQSRRAQAMSAARSGPVACGETLKVTNPRRWYPGRQSGAADRASSFKAVSDPGLQRAKTCSEAGGITAAQEWERGRWAARGICLFMEAWRGRVRRVTDYQRILTHPGGAHKDEFLACCLLVAVCGAPVLRREPDEADLADGRTAVVDVGGEHDAVRGNFDHHQFPKDDPPACALTLVLQHLGVYEDARSFCEWLEPAEWFDTRGPVETARWLGVERATLPKLNSPVDITLLRRFAQCRELHPGEPLWEVMRWIGQDLLDYLHGLRARLDQIGRQAEIWQIATPSGSFRALAMPRVEPMPDEPSAGLAKYIETLPEGERDIVALVYPDRRGAGFGLSRHNDHPGLDFTRIAECGDVHFAHARGFVAKTSATEPSRLRELLEIAWVG